jgi:hypothetical protein
MVKKVRRTNHTVMKKILTNISLVLLAICPPLAVLIGILVAVPAAAICTIGFIYTEFTAAIKSTSVEA